MSNEETKQKNTNNEPNVYKKFYKQEREMHVDKNIIVEWKF